ncbi:MAG: hypothetical protein WA125_17020 [Desulfosporosinus sp.]
MSRSNRDSSGGTRQSITLITSKIDTGYNNIDPMNCKFIHKLGYYLNSASWYDNKYWSAAGTMSNGGSPYHAYPALTLRAGTYIIGIPAGGAVYPTVFSWVKYANGTTGFLSEVLSGSTITLTVETTLYITGKWAVSNNYDASDYWIVTGSSATLPGAYVGRFTMPELISTPIVVDANGNGDYYRIQDAIDNCNDSATNPVDILIKRGTYDSFSMRVGGARKRYISLKGESNQLVTVVSYTGNYSTPAAEIWTDGMVSDIRFLMNATAGTYVPGGPNPYAYAVHDDFGASKVIYRNCIFDSNSGPGMGFGLDTDKDMSFENCQFYQRGDGTYGSKNIGALFGHTSSSESATNQKLEIANCIAVNMASDGTNGGIFVSELVEDTDCEILVSNTASFKGTAASANIPADLLSPYCHGNTLA